MRVGVHVSIAGGIGEAVTRATRLSCTTMQIFSRSPRGGPAPALSEGEARAFHHRRIEAGIEPLVVHGPYIINLASPDARTWGFSVRLYQEEYARCARLKAQYLVTHVGSHRGTGEAAGIARVADALSRTLEAHPGPVMILLENTAGAGQGLGERFEQLRAIRDGVRQRERIGICLDTAHLFVAGFPIHTQAGLEETLERCARVIGVEHVRVIHLNDSKSAFSSHLDRHWHIGQGRIGLEAFRRIVNHPRLRELPFVLETPKKTEDDDPRNLAMVRRLRLPTRRTTSSRNTTRTVRRRSHARV